MAKTLWNSGDDKWLTPALMVAFFGDSASTGHNHEGLDVDGSCPKIELNSGVSLNWVEFGVDVISTYFTTPISDAKWEYALIDDLVIIHVKTQLSGSHGSNTQFKISPNGGSWPASIIPTNLQKVVGLSMQPCASSIEERVGRVTINNSSGGVWELAITDNSAVLGVSSFGTANTYDKTLFSSQFFSYRKD